VGLCGQWAAILAVGPLVSPYCGVGKGSHAGRHFFVGKMAGTGGLFSPVSRVFAGFLQLLFFASYSPALCHLVLLLIG